MSPSAREYLRHILDEVQYILAHSQNIDKSEFLQDETLKRAFVRSIEIIGEAAKKVPTSVRQEHPEIEWRAIMGMRDHLVRGYFGIDYDIVWDVVSNKVRELGRHVQRILSTGS